MLQRCSVTNCHVQLSRTTQPVPCALTAMPPRQSSCITHQHGYCALYPSNYCSTAWQHGKLRQNVQAVRALQIDRRHHMELAWKRQQEREERLAQDVTFGKVIEVQDLEHLESLIDKAGSSLVVVCFYTRSCGACKALLQEFQHLCEEAKAQQVRAVFARHNLLNEFDYWSDISMWHKIRVVPTVMFYDGGAVVKKVTLHDVRRMGEAAPTIREQMQRDIKQLKTIFRQMLFEKAPGARS